MKPILSLSLLSLSLSLPPTDYSSWQFIQRELGQLLKPQPRLCQSKAKGIGAKPKPKPKLKPKPKPKSKAKPKPKPKTRSTTLAQPKPRNRLRPILSPREIHVIIYLKYYPH